jgi:peptidylprolyl isomerase
MKKLIPLLICNLVLITPQGLFATQIKAEKEAPKVELAKTEDSKAEASEELTADKVKLLSQAYGHMIGENLSTIGLALDNDQIIHGIQDAFNGAESPLDDTETIAMITRLRENKFRNECKTNLKQAEEFLASHSKDKDIIVLEQDKLQFKQMVKGSGKECALADTPIISYKGTYLNGEVFGESEKAEPISLQDTTAGFRQAIVGMKVGEKRQVFIHPDLAYGPTTELSPNALLTFEIVLEGIEKEEPVKDDAIGGMGSLPNEDAFADTPADHQHLK